jgi:hypothetical protein
MLNSDPEVTRLIGVERSWGMSHERKGFGFGDFQIEMFAGDEGCVKGIWAETYSWCVAKRAHVIRK